MADIIQRLPDSIANQIAAGEVVQRPASVVKELMENAIDAGSTSVKLIVRDAGKVLIQVIDSGFGMSETDARMSFERHATSKIREAKDLFSIRSMGFRGEALASIAAVAQVDMRTRLQRNELGTQIVVEGSKVVSQEACQCTAGTNISVKNLFFNVPARRNFLKSNAIEMRHILDEFQRIALANPDVFFSLHNNGTEIFHLQPGNLRQRIVGIFGENFNPRLVPVKLETENEKITGFIGKPEFARKTRGEQLFFVNHRFIKSGYLHHAVMSAYEGLIPSDLFPMYVLFLEMEPDRIDINVHPTKQEIKFDDEVLIYKYLRVAVRHALGQHNITPTLDFEQETSFSQTQNFGLPLNISSQQEYEQELSGKLGEEEEKSSRPFSPKESFSKPPTTARDQNNLRNWQKLYEGLEEEEVFEPDAPSQAGGTLTIESGWSSASQELDDAGGSFSRHQLEPYQIHNSYIVSPIKSGFVLIDQQAAHERILYEKYLETLENRQTWTQKELFQKAINLPPADAALLSEILPHINLLGFEIEPFGKDAFLINGIPADLKPGQDEQKLIETLLQQFKQNTDLTLGIPENLARSMARSSAIRKGQPLTIKEMQELIDKLFACAMPFKSPTGRNCFLTYDLEELEEKFKG